MKRILMSIFSLAMTSIIAQANAVTIYTVKGHFSSEGLSTSQLALLSKYQQYGVVASRTLSLTVLIDPATQGYNTVTSTNSREYLPFFESFGNMTSQQKYHGYANLLSSDIDFLHSTGPYMRNNFTNTQYYSYSSGRAESSGYIGIEQTLIIWQSGVYHQESAYVQNWKVGDNVHVQLEYNDGSGPLRLFSDFVVTGKVVDGVSAVPETATGVLLLSGIAVLGLGLRARRRLAVSPVMACRAGMHRTFAA